MDNNEMIKNYLNEDGKIVTYPSKKHKNVRPYLYQYLANKMEKGKEYKEIEINNFIKENILFSDFVLVRRELIDYGFINRKKDGSAYWVEESMLDKDLSLINFY